MKSKILLAFLVSSLLALASPVPTAASDGGLFYGDSIPAGIFVDHDVILFGKNVLVEGVVNGNVFILGNQVVVTGTVDGSLVLIAQNAAISGRVTDSIYALALTLDLPAGALLGRDLYAATVSLTSAPASTITRHLYALGLDAGLKGQVGGELHTTIGPIQLYNGLMHLLGYDELTLELHFELPAPPVDTEGFLSLRHMRFKFAIPSPSFDWRAWGLSLLRNWGVLMIFGLLLYWLAGSGLERSGEPLKARPLQTLAIGLLVLVVSFNLFIVALILSVLLFALGLGLNFLGLWQVTLALWVVGFAALLILSVALALFIAIGAKIVVAYCALSWLFGLFLRQKAVWSDLLALTLGITVYALLRSLPYAGWVIDLLVTSAGMGAAWLGWRNRPAPLPAPAEAATKARKKPVREQA